MTPVARTRASLAALTSAALAALLLLAGCNTTRGFGEDVEAAGEEIEETAEETRDAITE